jgi:glutathione S-transferase
VEIILHNNPRSMYSEKVRRVLAYKGLAWADIEVPALPPKDDLVPLTGGYRRMPVLQLGADIYCDSALILEKLEELAPEPAIFPAGVSARARMVADWVDHRVARWAIVAVFPDYLQLVSEAFIRDRTALIPDLAPERVRVLAPHAADQFEQFALFLEDALRESQFVVSDPFTAADAACYHVVNFVSANPRVFARVEKCAAIRRWMERIAAFPSPEVTRKPGDYPLTVARDNTPTDFGSVAEPSHGLRFGDRIIVFADDYATERISGELVKLTPTEVAVRQSSTRLGEIVIHFPRMGFCIEPATTAAQEG